jgi:hypothetical protein
MRRLAVGLVVAAREPATRSPALLGMRRLAICLTLAAVALLAQAPKAELLWPKGAPGALGTSPEDQPSLAPFVLAKGSGAGTADGEPQ